MIYPLFAFRDKFTGFGAPTPDMNEYSAKRNFSVMLVNDPIKSHSPADFDFYQVGEYDSDSGEIKAITPIKFICNGQEVFPSEN